MKYKYIWLLIAGLAIKLDGYAQNYSVDALRFSQYQFGSSSRLKGLGNAQTAVGGDISSIGGNPAGLGLFTRSEFSLTTEIMQYSTESNYFGTNTDASRGKVNINNLGAVFVLKLNKGPGQDPNSGAISLNFGLGYNKTNDFGNKIMFSGLNNQNSIGNFYADLANDYTGNLVSGSLEDAAYNANLIDNPNNGNFISTTNPNNQQNEILIRNGSLSEFNLSAGLNVSNKFYLGASLGILGLRYSSDNTFTETGTVSYSDGNGNYSENYATDYYQRYQSRGSGINAKVGMIFRPNQFIRLGATAQSPNYYTIDDDYSESNLTNLTNNPYYEDQRVISQNNAFDTFTYNLKTPAKYTLGAALFQNKLGFLTAELEFLDYSSIELETKGYDSPNQFIEDNRFIVNNYKNAINYKVGAEIKAHPAVMIRGGYMFNASPVENSDLDLDVNTFSVGAGYRIGNVNLDVAYQTSSLNSQTSPYLLQSNSPMAVSKTNRSGIFLTLGAKF